MIWDMLNSVLVTTAAALKGVWAALPSSPIYLPSGLAASIDAPLHTLAWFWPVQASVDFLLVYFVAVGALIVFLAVKQFIEAIVP